MICCIVHLFLCCNIWRESISMSILSVSIFFLIAFNNFKAAFQRLLFCLCVLIVSHMHFRVNLHIMQLPDYQGTGWSNRHDIWSLRNCNRIWTHSHLVHKRTVNHLTKLTSLAKWLSLRLQTKQLWVQTLLQST